MKLHEYQAKALLAKHGVPVPQGRVATTPDEAAAIAAELGGKVVVKAQAHTGGRGKGGGVKLANSADEARQAAADIIGMQLVTHQTGPSGLPVHSVLVEEQLDIERELYLSVVIDNSAGMPVVIASAAGGMDIEEVAANTPEQIHQARIDPTVGFQGFQARALAFATGLDGDLLRPATALITGLVRAFEASDGSLAEINPVVVTKDGKLSRPTPSSTSTTTPTSARRSSSSSATARRRTTARSRRRTPASGITSSSMATSAAS